MYKKTKVAYGPIRSTSIAQMQLHIQLSHKVSVGLVSIGQSSIYPSEGFRPFLPSIEKSNNLLMYEQERPTK
ncbi:hypothetical protein BPOR_1686g00010 [Botrytis porri]|uniref:Uncharacterized protein n=1 Tax=Botrytis porri TaxID=87229 RepID=A0A4Z1KH88_9HELO|nr:hypothetical protein BPOR_1686g00010 [Botrytis porri]